jgi:hypothetical protein
MTNDEMFPEDAPPVTPEDVVNLGLQAYELAANAGSKSLKLQALRTAKQSLHLGVTWSDQKGPRLADDLRKRAVELYLKMDEEIAKAKALPSKRGKTQARAKEKTSKPRVPK